MSDRAASIPVSVVIPVKNEAEALPACLERLVPFAEVIVVDSHSTDATAQIAIDWGARVIQFQWSGGYPKKRNHVLLNEMIAAPWVLFLDADEHVTQEFCSELLNTLQTTNNVGFWITYSNVFNAQTLRYGVPQRKLSLIKNGAGLYEHIDDAGWSALDMEVHEHPVVEGSVGRIKARIDHRDDRGIERFLARHIDYARWEAKRYLAMRHQPETNSHLTQRQKFKYRHISRWWYPWFYFFYTVFVRGGIRDGRAGLSYALYKAWYFETVRTLITEHMNPSADPSNA
ncbi:MAG: glycosyltransferase family 2 protein [Pseudomonadota bacterium]